MAKKPLPSRLSLVVDWAGEDSPKRKNKVLTGGYQPPFSDT